MVGDLLGLSDTETLDAAHVPVTQADDLIGVDGVLGAATGRRRDVRDAGKPGLVFSVDDRHGALPGRRWLPPLATVATSGERQGAAG